ncbi:MAG TPA: transglutaminaseTgpA domain-containing protein [Gemmataceae bacterium]|jgi:transglutaminase-like putative cysteine protease
MSLEHWFRLSQYLTLGLACAALVFAETPFLPELQLFLAPVLALLLLAWWVEGRWSLPNWGANILGGLIAVGGGTWLVQTLSDETFVLSHLPLHLALLPYMGPLAMAALLVKVFRTHDANHFWHLQGWGLLQIGLGCLLDGGPAFGAMMVAYLASDLLCLALHYRLSIRKEASSDWRSGNVSSRADNAAANAVASPIASPSITGGSLFVFAMRWTFLISATTLLIFLLTPRRDNWSWEPLNKFHTGGFRYPGNSQGGSEEMNLNNTGWIELDDEVALRVTALDAAGQPKVDLSPEQRFRGSVLDWYENGKWTTTTLMPARPRRGGQVDLPNFGPDQFFLDFTVQPRQAGGLVLAEPIRFGPPPSARLPVVVLNQEDRRRLFVESSGTVLPQIGSEQRNEYRYRQVMPGHGSAERFPAEGLWANKDVPLLRTVPPPLLSPLQDCTVDLLRRLTGRLRNRLPEKVRADLAKPPQNFQVESPHWEAVARVLTDYLANSGDFTYTLELTRHDRSLDPVLDFLINLKQGHCERFAAALALTLRSIAIPARVVKGFRGCDSQGEGLYVVRHSHAHAWVEILVPRGWNRFDWLVLDATPPAPAVSASGFSFSYFWEEAGKFCLQWWRSLILEYDGDEQAGLWEMLISLRPMVLLRVLGLIGSASIVLIALGLFLHRQRRSRNGVVVCSDGGIYSRLVRILARNVSLRPRLAQTPREYVTEAHTLLLARPRWAALAELPRRVVDLFYRVRFGGRPLNAGERQEIKAELDRFAEALHPISRKRSDPEA